MTELRTEFFQALTPNNFIFLFETIYCFLGTGTYGTGEKRRKPMQLSSLTYLLEDSEVIDDLKIINKNKAFSVRTLIFWFHS